MSASKGKSHNPLERAERRGQESARDLLRAHPMLSLADVARRMRVAASEVTRLHKERQLLAIRHHGQLRYPEFQFDGDQPLRGLHQVLQALDEVDGWTALNFLVTPDLRLDGRTPLQALRGGDAEAARRAAAAYGQHEPA